jgi:hypothetical protein
LINVTTILRDFSTNLSFDIFGITARFGLEHGCVQVGRR